MWYIILYMPFNIIYLLKINFFFYRKKTFSCSCLIAIVKLFEFIIQICHVFTSPCRTRLDIKEDLTFIVMAVGEIEELIGRSGGKFAGQINFLQNGKIFQNVPTINFLWCPTALMSHRKCRSKTTARIFIFVYFSSFNIWWSRFWFLQNSMFRSPK